MFSQTAEAGTPGISMRWSKDSVIKSEVRKNSDSRFVAYVKVNNEAFYSLPGTHPTEADAKLTLAAYIAENSYKE